MNARIELNLDKKTFLRWAQEQEGRYEWVDGKIFMQQSATRGHGNVAMRMAHEFILRLDLDLWNVLGADLAVDLGDQIRVPDVMVERVNADNKALATDEPVVLVEVLSPSSIATDMNIKPPRYMALPSLEAYIVASQDEARCWIWQRDIGKPDRPFPAEPVTISGPDAKLEVTALGVSVALADIYRGMFKS